MSTQLVNKINGFVAGQVIPLNQVKDEVFSNQMMGKTLAVVPSSNEIYAPISGEVTSIFPTKHAMTLKGENGEELLLHFGIDTVQLKGEGFNIRVKEKQIVSQGELIAEMDVAGMREKGVDTTIFLVLVNVKDFTFNQLSSTYEVFQPYLSVERVAATETTEESHTEKLEDIIMTNLGGSDNVQSMTFCATRLRVNVADKKKVNYEVLENADGVMGVVDSMGGVQVIIGNQVSDLYQKIQNSYSFRQISDEQPDIQGKESLVNRFLNMLSAVIGPAIPLIMASGLISAILVICTRLGMNVEGNTYYFLSSAANVAFYFLPFFLANNAAKRFKTDPMLALFMAGLLLHPNILDIGKHTSVFGIPVTPVDYSSSLIPIILTVWLLSYIEKYVTKLLPSAITFMIKPLVVILIMLPITLCVTGPLGAILGNGLASILTTIYAHASWLALLLVSALSPLLVMTGMHLALIPLVLANFETLGYDNLLFVAFIGMNFSQFGISMAVLLKTKNTKLRELAGSSALTAFLCGVTEPALYGITIKLKKPLIATFITCIVNGIFCAITSVKIFSFGAPAFFTIPIFLNPDGTNTNLIFAIIAIIISVVVSFVVTWMVGFDDNAYEN